MRKEGRGREGNKVEGGEGEEERRDLFLFISFFV